MKLAGKVAFDTGSARGIGWEIANSYARSGAAVVNCDLRQADVNDALTRSSLPTGLALGIAADVTVE